MPSQDIFRLNRDYLKSLSDGQLFRFGAKGIWSALSLQRRPRHKRRFCRAHFNEFDHDKGDAVCTLTVFYRASPNDTVTELHLKPLAVFVVFCGCALFPFAAISFSDCVLQLFQPSNNSFTTQHRSFSTGTTQASLPCLILVLRMFHSFSFFFLVKQTD